MNIKHRSAIYILIASILLMIALQTSAAIHRSFWLDEAWTSRIARYELNEVVQTSVNDRHPPLYFIFMSLWGRLAGYSELALRLPSIFFMALTSVLVYMITSELFDRRTALVASLLTTLSPFVITYGFNARYYSLSAALGLTIIFSLYKYTKSNRILFLIIYIISSTTLLFTVFTGITIIFAGNIWWLWEWKRRKGLAKQLFYWFIAQVVIAVFCIPWFPMLAVTANADVIPIKFTLAWAIEVLKSIAYLGFAFSLGEAFSPINPAVWIGIGLIIFLMITAVKSNNKNFWKLATFFCFIASMNIVISSISVFPVSAWQGIPNRIFYAFPYFIILLAYGITKLNRRSFMITLSAIIAIFCMGIFNYFSDRQLIKPYLAVPWSNIFEQIKSNSNEDAMVVCDYVDYSCRFYANEFELTFYSSKQWKKVLEDLPSETWWVHINIGTSEFRIDRDIEGLTTLADLYNESTINNYTRQDPSIQWLKARFLNQVEYDYRVNVYKFFNHP